MLKSILFRGVSLVMFISVGLRADIILSADVNIVDPLAYNTGNQQLFKNILDEGNNVLILQDVWSNWSPIVNSFYNNISGVTSTVITGELSSEDLVDIDLFIAPLPGDEFLVSEIGILDAFLSNGGTLFFLGDNDGFSWYNGYINNALNSLGSEMQIQNGHFGSGFQTASGSQIINDPLTQGVSSIEFAATSRVIGGNPIVYNADNPIIAYEGNPTQSVPEPSIAVLLLICLSGLGFTLIGRFSLHFLSTRYPA